ncbi:MAG: methionine gamma-lyase family protein, partial [Oscillospiraceae bacterium]
MSELTQLSPALLRLAELAEQDAAPQFSAIDALERDNGMKVLGAFLDHGISAAHLLGTTGYGYGDMGRDALDRVFAQVFGAEDALVRHHFVSGT